MQSPGETLFLSQEELDYHSVAGPGETINLRREVVLDPQDSAERPRRDQAEQGSGAADPRLSGRGTEVGLPGLSASVVHTETAVLQTFCPCHDSAPHSSSVKLQLAEYTSCFALARSVLALPA